MSSLFNTCVRSSELKTTVTFINLHLSQHITAIRWWNTNIGSHSKLITCISTAWAWFTFSVLFHLFYFARCDMWNQISSLYISYLKRSSLLGWHKTYCGDNMESRVSDKGQKVEYTSKPFTYHITVQNTLHLFFY